ncbi:nucleotidyl transferase [Prosthecochloris sp. GSB1]|uniref:sugar phosphate nucleotidyltransferase n=1 Tax=Prosthecochloris sp. GSB1 TaxID=281093 RepID=UPI000B8D0647|nr:sugar phosphate nucleotidyltransferase [Prosthecochloris sp. GSB1]ASQ89718.1 nucleotidyl transferase [Prosthecochloris sp. GSB1]
MKAFILAAGHGTRLQPLTQHIPKPLIPVLNVPAICYALFLLKETGVDTVICNVHHHADQLRSFFRGGWDFGMDIHISDERDILGTGGGLKQCERLLDDGPFLLVNSDIIADFDLKAAVRTHRDSTNSGTLILFETPSAKTIGDVCTHGGKIVDFRNMLRSGRRSNLIYAGAAVLDPSIFRYLSPGFSSIVDTGYTGLISENALGSFLHTGLWQDIGTPQSLWAANTVSGEAFLKRFMTMRRLFGAGPNMIADTSVISRKARVYDSVVGAGCRICESALVEQAVILPGTVIEKNRIVRKEIVFPEGSLSIGVNTATG